MCEIAKHRDMLRALARTSAPIPVRRQRKSHIPAQWGMRLCHSGMPLVVTVSSPLGVVARSGLQIIQREGHALTFADVCANSGPSSEKESHSGPMGHVSVPFRHAPGGAVSSPLGVVIRCVLPSPKRVTWF